MGRIRVALEERLWSPELLVDEAVNSLGRPARLQRRGLEGRHWVVGNLGKDLEKRPGFSQGSFMVR